MEKNKKSRRLVGKSFLTLSMLALWVSCTEPTPNDRALFNLQGPVESVEYEGENPETMAFMQDGSFDYSRTTAEYAGEINRFYGKLEFVPEGGDYTALYEYDKKGRLIKESREDNLGNEYFVDYKYDGDDRLPEYKKITSVVDGNETVEEGNVVYGQVDEWGNWSSRTWNGIDVTRRLSYWEQDGTCAVVENCPMDRSVDWEKVVEVLVAILFFVLSFAMVAHMVYERFIKKPLREDYTVDYFKKVRTTAEYQDENEANQIAGDLLGKLYADWTPIDEEGNSRIPFSRNDIKNAYLTLDKVVALAPVDNDVVSALNECTSMLNLCQKRSFTGSKTFLIVAVIIALLLSLISGTWRFFVIIAISSVVYYLASLTPDWMEMKKELKGKSGKPKFMTRIFGALFGAVATAKTVTTVTKWSDGTKDVEHDNSEFWISLVFAIIVMVVLSVFMFFVAAISYLRNYVIYR